MPQLSKDQYLERLCNNRKCSIEELHKWIDRMELTVAPCQCTDYPNCCGWRLYFPEELESVKEENDAATE